MLFDREIFTAGTCSKQAPFALPEEEALIVGATERRRLEFLNGRASAHAALRSLGADDAPITRGAEGEPVWPPHTIGSISHASGFCAAAVAYCRDYVAVGLDVESDTPASPQFAARVCSPRELDGGAEIVPSAATVVFSVKETINKLQYPQTGAMLSWRDIEVRLEDGCFSARLFKTYPPFCAGATIEGRWQRGAGLIFTAAAISRFPIG